MSWLNNIKRCIQWLPIIWKDRDWDFQHLLNILEFKLRNMQHFFESDKPQKLYAQRDGQKIKQVADALQRYRENHYCEEWYQILYAYHGEIKIQTKPYKDDMVEFDGFRFTHSDNQERALKIWRMLNNRSNDLMQRDFEFVFNVLRTDLQNWWD